MGSLGKLVAVSISLMGLVLVSSAAAHELEASRANKANKSFAKSFCSGSDESCISAAAGPCQRISDHRVRCLLYTTLEAEDKSRGRCTNVMEWYIRGKSPLLLPRFVGIRSCQQVRPPQPPVLP
jgi:hypothetical protein